MINSQVVHLVKLLTISHTSPHSLPSSNLSKTIPTTIMKKMLPIYNTSGDSLHAMLLPIFASFNGSLTNKHININSKIVGVTLHKIDDMTLFHL
jgi:hypothetical protein